MLGEWDEDEDLFADETWGDDIAFDPDDDGFDLRGSFGEDDDEDDAD